MLEDKRIAFVGSGNMGSAMVGAAIDRLGIVPAQIIASDIDPAQGASLEKRYGIQSTTSNAAAVAEAHLVILAIKPQVLSTVLIDLEGQIPPQAAVLSIVAGATLGTLVEGLRHTSVIRAMPNTPAQIGEGMTVWVATAETSAPQRQQVQALLQAMGQEVEVREEKYLDMATAVSGSGPAYVFLFIESMIDAAVYLGFSRPVARQLVLQTVIGAARYTIESGRDLAELRNMVTSPGGTTAEALYAMERGRLRATVLEGIRAAYEKSQRLAGHD